MENFYQTLSFIDLISEKHKQLRQQLIQQINNEQEKDFSEMEIFLIFLLCYKPLSVSDAARIMGISRQAAHKHAKHLIERKYIQIIITSTNRRDKVLEPTEKGKIFYQYYCEIKQALERQIKEEIGEKEYKFIERIFKLQWNID